MTPGVLPESYKALGVRPLDGLMEVFGEVVRAASPEPDPTVAILSAGPDDQYYLDHKVFAAELGAILAERHEVEIDRDGRLVHKGSGRRIDVVYERIESGRIYDDVPGLIEAQARGLVDAVFAPNLGIADDKGVYPFVPEMIRTYLGEEPVLANVETYSLAVEEDRRYVMDHFEELVIKSRSGWGGTDVLIAPQESSEDIEGFRRQVEENPVEYVAQETIDFSTHVLCETTRKTASSCATPTPTAHPRPRPRRRDGRGRARRHDAGRSTRQQTRQHLQRGQDEGHLGVAWCVR